jgi:hypothetical protein
MVAAVVFVVSSVVYLSIDQPNDRGSNSSPAPTEAPIVAPTAAPTVR